MKQVLVFGNTLGAGSKSHVAIRYFTGWDSHEALSLLILSDQEKILLVGSSLMVPSARERLSKTAVINLPPSDRLQFLLNKFMKYFPQHFSANKAPPEQPVGDIFVEPSMIFELHPNDRGAAVGREYSHQEVGACQYASMSKRAVRILINFTATKLIM